MTLPSNCFPKPLSTRCEYIRLLAFVPNGHLRFHKINITQSSPISLMHTYSNIRRQGRRQWYGCYGHGRTRFFANAGARLRARLDREESFALAWVWLHETNKVRSRSPCTRKYYCKNCLRKRASYPAYRKYLWPMASRRSFYVAQRTGRSGRLTRSYV